MVCRISAVSLLWAAFAPAQTSKTSTPPSAPMFEVASVRASNPRSVAAGVKSGDGRGGGSFGFQVEHQRFSVTNANLFQLIVRAYAVKGCPPGPRIADCPLLSGGPEWVKKETFDIQAKMPDGSSEYTTLQFMTGQAPQLQLMLQSLLAGRFNLNVRREKRQLPVYTLTLAKKGPKLKRAKAGETELGPIFRPMTEANGETTIQMTVQNKSIADVAETFSMIFNRPVLDRTGLQGKYDFTMQYEGNADQPGAFTELIGPGLLTAFQEQAGLKLDSTKASVEVLVIDHAERPSEN